MVAVLTTLPELSTFFISAFVLTARQTELSQLQLLDQLTSRHYPTLLHLPTTPVSRLVPRFIKMVVGSVLVTGYGAKTMRKSIAVD